MPLSCTSDAVSYTHLDVYKRQFRQIRELSPAVPVIALTAYAFETDRRRMFDAGFDDCLAKPLRADELRARVAAMLAAKEDI